MPAGYYGSVVLAMVWNSRYRKLAAAELKRRRLGPFRVPGQTQDDLQQPLALGA
jgi:hypothetical protein